MDDSDLIGGLIGLVIGIAIVAFIIYVIVLIATAVLMIAGGCGLAWGGGVAAINYGKSFKANVIDSNRAAA